MDSCVFALSAAPKTLLTSPPLFYSSLVPFWYDQPHTPYYQGVMDHIQAEVGEYKLEQQRAKKRAGAA